MKCVLCKVGGNIKGLEIETLSCALVATGSCPKEDLGRHAEEGEGGPHQQGEALHIVRHRRHQVHLTLDERIWLWHSLVEH